MDFLWFWVFLGLITEFIRRSVKHCYSKRPDKASPNRDTLNEALLGPVEKSDCPYSCCAIGILNYETDTEESPRSVESTDEIVSLPEIEEDEESLFDRRKGKPLVQDNDGMQEIVGRLYPCTVPGQPKLASFKVSHNYFEVSDIAGARLATEARLAKEASAKIHPQPNGIPDQGHSLMRNSSSQFSKDKEGIPSGEIADEYRILPVIQEAMSSPDVNFSGSDKIRSSDGQCSHERS